MDCSEPLLRALLPLCQAHCSLASPILARNEPIAGQHRSPGRPIEPRGFGGLLNARSALAVIAMVAVLPLSFARSSQADEWAHFKRATRDLIGEDTGDHSENLWLPPASNVHPRRRKPKADWPLLHRQLYCYSYPAKPSLQSILNPWGEQAPMFTARIEDFPGRLLATCEVYRYQGVRFDGYLGSEDDGQHLFAAADGLNVAWFGDNEARTYRRVLQSVTDALDERCWICVDLPVFALNLAGFPIRQALIAHFLESPELYTASGWSPENVPLDALFFRRVENVRLYFRHKQFYSDDHITTAQFLDPDYRPRQPFRPGDIIFMGHYKGDDPRGPFGAAKHSGVVESVDERGMPLHLYNMRTSNRLLDRYDEVIDQTRVIKGRLVYFRHFYDRYSIIGHARIVQPFELPDAMPTLETVRAFLAKKDSAPTSGPCSLARPAFCVSP